MAFHLPSKAVRAPELLIPGRKPVGPVKIDWSNPMSRGLVHYWLLDKGHQKGDILDGNTWYAVGAYPFGSPDHFTTFQVEPGTPVQLPTSRITTFDGFSVIVGNKRTAGVVNWSYLDTSYSGWTGLYQEGEVFKSASLSTFDGQVAPVSGPRRDDRVDFCSFSIETGRFAASINGGEVTTDTSFTLPTFSSAHNGPTLGASQNNSFYNHSATSFKYFGIYNRSLTDEELKALASNPYQFLIPA